MPNLCRRFRSSSVIVSTSSSPMGIFHGRTTRIPVVTDVAVFLPSGTLVGICDDVVTI